MHQIQLRTTTFVAPARATRPIHLRMLLALALPLLLGITFLRPAFALDEYLLTPGDVIRITVFKNPDLTLEARVSEAGTIGFPLVGSVPVSGLSLQGAEKKI